MKPATWIPTFVGMTELFNDINRCILQFLVFWTTVERFMLFSLLVGVRAPDSEGFHLTNLDALRAIHVAPDGQYDHCLRGDDDDYTEGNTNAWESCVEALIAQIHSVREYLNEESLSEQIIKVNFSLDFYGTFKVDVWGPAYYLGRAVHVLQDSFSHTVRTSDFRQIVHVMNFVEAIDGSLDKERDGLAHSRFTDRCDLEVRQSLFATIEASADLLRATAQEFDEDRSESGTHFAETAIGKWMELLPQVEAGGCTLDNDLCHSPWMENAQKDPEQPIVNLSCWMQGVGIQGGSPWLFMVLLLLFAPDR